MIGPILTKHVLFAEMVMSDVSLQFREEKLQRSWTEHLWFLAIPVVAVAAAYGIYRLAQRRQVPSDSPHDLLVSLGDCHRLNRPAVELLQRIAEVASLPQPATMFAAPEFFQAGVDAADAKGAIGDEDRATLKELRERLFAA